VGYYFAAFTIDRPWMGRMRMQAMGFAWMGERLLFGCLVWACVAQVARLLMYALGLGLLAAWRGLQARCLHSDAEY